MAKTNISIRVDADLKRAFKRICENADENITTVINALVRQTVRDNKIPVDLSADPFYCEANISFLEKGIAELDAGKGIRMTMEEFDAFANTLLASRKERDAK